VTISHEKYWRLSTVQLRSASTTSTATVARHTQSVRVAPSIPSSTECHSPCRPVRKIGALANSSNRYYQSVAGFAVVGQADAFQLGPVSYRSSGIVPVKFWIRPRKSFVDRKRHLRLDGILLVVGGLWARYRSQRRWHKYSSKGPTCSYYWSTTSAERFIIGAFSTR
jgi:hypothetical protein